MRECETVLQRTESRKPKENVLVVEDDSDLAETLVTALTVAGYGVRAVSTRDEALRAIRRNLYHIVLLDFKMPGLAANDFLAEVNRQPLAPKSSTAWMTMPISAMS